MSGAGAAGPGDASRYPIEEDPVFAGDAVEAPFLAGARGRQGSFEERTAYNDIPDYGGEDDDPELNSDTGAPVNADDVRLVDRSAASPRPAAAQPKPQPKAAAAPQPPPPPPPPQPKGMPSDQSLGSGGLVPIVPHSQSVGSTTTPDRGGGGGGGGGGGARVAGGGVRVPRSSAEVKELVAMGGQGAKGFFSELFDATPFFDANGNGRLDPWDLPGVTLSMQVAGGGADAEKGGAASTAETPEAARAQQQAVQMQKIPLFVLLQTSAVLGPWIIEIFKHIGGAGGDRGLADIKVGFESLFPGSTDLRLTKDCEDYRAHFWRWFTYQWTHVGIFHVITNTVLNCTLGVALEGFHGTWVTAAIFNLGVLGGAMCYRVLDAHESVVGMSAGCYAFMGMFLATTLMNWNQMKYPRMRMLYLLVIAALDFMQASLVTPKDDNSVPSYSVHFGGYVAGLLLGISQGRNLVLEEWERKVKFISIGVGCLLFVFSFSWGMAWPPRSILESDGWCWARQVQSATLFGDDIWHCVKCASEDCISTFANEHYVSEVSISMCDDVYGWTTIVSR